jgi:hypothetical protein
MVVFWVDLKLFCSKVELMFWNRFRLPLYRTFSDNRWLQTKKIGYHPRLLLALLLLLVIWCAFPFYIQSKIVGITTATLAERKLLHQNTSLNTFGPVHIRYVYSPSKNGCIIREMPFSSSRSDSQCGITRQLRNESFHFSTVYTSVLRSIRDRKYNNNDAEKFTTRRPSCGERRRSSSCDSGPPHLFSPAGNLQQTTGMIFSLPREKKRILFAKFQVYSFSSVVREDDFRRLRKA